uniref:BPTI/Kunitz inhibitor domain-containing protein n=1 Tax=Caenorhabditis japonica TaxID=281687 RepID=A0A8R1E0I2_CAEJA
MFAVLVVLLCLSSAAAAKSRWPDPPVFASPATYPSICYLPPDSALCDTSANSSEMNLLTRYYFDVATQECYPFGVQKCGGNQNQFNNRQECQEFCKTSDSSIL